MPPFRSSRRQDWGLRPGAATPWAETSNVKRQTHWTKPEQDLWIHVAHHQAPTCPEKIQLPFPPHAAHPLTMSICFVGIIFTSQVSPNELCMHQAVLHTSVPHHAWWLWLVTKQISDAAMQQYRMISIMNCDATWENEDAKPWKQQQDRGK